MNKIAIIGISTLFPDAETPAQYWQNLLAQNDSRLMETAVLLSSLRIVARVKGISNIAEQANMIRQGVQKALSVNGNPRLESFMAIVRAMGYRLAVEKVE